MKKASVFPAQGIGDALLMLIASYHLQEADYEVTTYHPALLQLQPWLKNHKFSVSPSLENFQSILSKDDLIILENDNSPKSQTFIHLRNEGLLNNLSVFYPTYSQQKHGPLFPKDQVFNPNLSMAENIAKSVSRLLKSPGVSKNNGLTPLPGLNHRQNRSRIVLHPTSSSAEKNWPADKFLKLAKALEKSGYEPVFAVSSAERENWEHLIQNEFALPVFPTLSELASFIYESGYVIGNDSLLGHLASNLQIPSLIIANDEKRMRLWRPGWLKGEIATPSPLLPKWKFFRRYWTSCIPIAQVLRSFYKLSRSL